MKKKKKSIDHQHLHDQPHLQKEKATNGHTNPPPSQSKPQTTTTPIQTSKSEHINIQIPRLAIQNRSPQPTRKSHAKETHQRL